MDLDELKLNANRQQQIWNMKMSLQGGQKNSGVDVLFARRKIAALMDSLHSGADKQSVRSQVTKIALNHHLVSKYTSMVAVDVTPSRPESSDLHRSNVPNNLPHGQVIKKSVTTLAQTATSWKLNLLIGLVCLAIMIVMTLRSRNPRMDSLA